MERIVENWQQRSPSEKIVLAVVGILMICSLFYLLVFEPITQLREKENNQWVKNEKTLSQVSRLAARYQGQASPNKQAYAGLASVVNQSLQKNNLKMQGFQPGKRGDARLRLSNVPYDSLVKWLYDLEYKHSISVEELTISQAKTEGSLMVSVRVVKN